MLLFALYPQAFLLLPRRESIVATVVLTAVFTLVLIAKDGWTGEAIAWRGLMAVGNLAVALVIGLFIDGIVRESAQRKALRRGARTPPATSSPPSSAAAGASAERERLAREIHDTLAQGFTSIVVLAQTGEAAARRRRPRRGGAPARRDPDDGAREPRRGACARARP